MFKKTLFTIIIFLGLTPFLWADSYYCIIFAYDSQPVPVPFMCHIWGTFVCLDDDSKLKEEITISWEPNKISYINKARPGKNISLKETLDIATNKNRKIRMFGPYSTNKDYYNKAKTQWSSNGTYRFIDCFWRGSSQNCIHRLSDVVGYHKTGIYWGHWAAGSICSFFEREGVIQPTKNGELIIRILYLRNYKIERMK